MSLNGKVGIRGSGKEQTSYINSPPEAIERLRATESHKYQSMEFSIRRRVLSAAEILRSTTTIAARLCRMEGRIGVLAPEAFADLLAVEGDPFADVTLLEQSNNLLTIMKNGIFYKNALVK